MNAKFLAGAKMCVCRCSKTLIFVLRLLCEHVEVLCVRFCSSVFVDIIYDTLDNFHSQAFSGYDD